LGNPELILIQDCIFENLEHTNSSQAIHIGRENSSLYFTTSFSSSVSSKKNYKRSSRGYLLNSLEDIVISGCIFTNVVLFI
jgi:hypothetical protein